MPFQKAIYICSPKRTPIGSFQGLLAPVAAPELAAQVLQDIIRYTGIDKSGVDQVILGCVLTANLGQAPARQALLKADLASSTQALTVNKVCSSGLKAVALAASEVELGNAEVVIAGGMESMSRAPYVMPSLRTGARLGNATAVDLILQDGLLDPLSGKHMGICGEMCAKKFNLTREAQDEYAVESYTRAQNAIEGGFFKSEISPVVVGEGKKAVTVLVDEEPGKLRPEKVKELKPAFDPVGTITAVNASSLSDGAAAMVICSAAALKKYNLQPAARIVAQAWHSQEPEWFTTAPIGAIEKLLAQTGRKKEEIDLFEINEAFSAVAMACQKELGIDREVLNISGGAVALGHPIGASGARIIVTLTHNLLRLGLKRGVAAICNGGGEATALLVETA